jgi:hypothetical protein
VVWPWKERMLLWVAPFAVWEGKNTEHQLSVAKLGTVGWLLPAAGFCQARGMFGRWLWNALDTRARSWHLAQPLLWPGPLCPHAGGAAPASLPLHFLVIRTLIQACSGCNANPHNAAISHLSLVVAGYRGRSHVRACLLACNAQVWLGSMYCVTTT